MKKLLAFIFTILICTNVWAQKITDLTEDTSPTSDDLLYTVNDPGGTPASRKVTISNFLSNISSDIDLNGNMIESNTNGIQLDSDDDGTAEVTINSAGDLDVAGVITSGGSGDSNFTGNVGIGSASPQTELDVVGTGTFSTDVIVAGQSVCLEDGTNCTVGGGGVGMGTVNPGVEGFYPRYTSTSTVIDDANSPLFTDGTNIGIGTTGLAAALTLANGEYIQNATDDNIVFGGSGGTSNSTLTVDLDGAVTLTPSTTGINVLGNFSCGSTVTSSSARLHCYEDSSQSSTVYAGNLEFVNQGAGTTYGLNVRGARSGTGGANSVYGIVSRGNFTGTGTQTNVYGLNTAGIINNAGGTVENFYGIYASPMTLTAGTVTNNWAGYFNGQVGVNGPINLVDTVPADTSFRLYNQSGSLYWNGSAVGAGGGLANPLTADLDVGGYMVESNTGGIKFDVDDDGVNDIVFSSSGFIGVGLQNPTASIYVYTADSNTGSVNTPKSDLETSIVIRNETQSTNAWAGLAFSHRASNQDYIWLQSIYNGDNSLDFRIGEQNSPDATLTEWMRFKSSGNVGIGESNPRGLLEVAGDTFIGSGTFDNASASSDLYVTGNLEVDGTIYGDGSQLTGISAGGGGWTDGNPDPYVTDITDSVGIGTTTPLAMLHVGAGAGATNVGDNDVYIVNDLEVDGTIYAGAINVDTSFIELQQAAAPSPTTDRLYNVSGDIYWNGTQLGSGGSFSGTMTSDLEMSGYMIESNTQGIRFDVDDDGVIEHVFNSAGNVGINTTSTSTNLFVNATTGNSAYGVIISNGVSSGDFLCTRNNLGNCTYTVNQNGDGDGINLLNNAAGTEVWEWNTSTSGTSYITGTGNADIYLGWGSGTFDNPTSDGDIYVEGNLEVDGNIYMGGGAVGCIMLRDTDDAGWTECFVLNGTMSCTTDADGICDGS